MKATEIPVRVTVRHESDEALLLLKRLIFGQITPALIERASQLIAESGGWAGEHELRCVRCLTGEADHIGQGHPFYEAAP